MKIALASDHAGFELKEYIKGIIEKAGYSFVDLGTHTEDSVDYSDFGFKAAELVSTGEADKGILICGTGMGMNIVANKVKGIRASLVQDLYTAIQSRKHLDANVLVLGARVIGKGMAEEIVKVWLGTSFEGGRHERRVKKIKQWEEKHLK
ncbi:MAG: ribose 5-phosphate isomerase B [Proteobacteria bacterium]|nr:ribose 5-phosphate isomerase B [Pseudomonadota bacterium]